MEPGGEIKKGVEGRKGNGPKKKPVTRSVRAELQFPIGKVGRYLKKGRTRADPFGSQGRIGKVDGRS
ncbi:hypothetical protein VNO80_06933 [Phaseolus coccineus]|uniref:Histone H2A n=1 Tax=Phaseolus coccineus TaxID=3886 RepID=A0AAN9REX4_PHACN